MRRIFLVLLVFLCSSTAFAGSDDGPSVVTAEFSKAMGLDSMLQAVLDQSRESLNSSMLDLASNLKDQLPELNEEQEKAFKQIFSTYIDSIVDSVDADKAAEIYSTVIANGLPAEEIKAAADYYQTPEGQRLLRVVNEAAGKLNEYILNQVIASAKIAQAQLSESLGEFETSFSNTTD